MKTIYSLFKSFWQSRTSKSLINHLRNKGIKIGVGCIITIIIACFGEKLLKLNFGDYRYQTYAYTFILSFMSVFSVAVACFKPVFLIFALGIVFIFLSDLVLSKQYFGGKQDCKVLTTLNHAIYYAGQIAIAFSLFFI